MHGSHKAERLRVVSGFCDVEELFIWSCSCNAVL